MEDRSEFIFGNPMSRKTIDKGYESKRKYIRKFGDDRKKEYHLKPVSIPCLEDLEVKNLIASDEPFRFPSNAVIIGNIRMGFGHYRISIAMASCARALGYEPYWFDLASFDSTGSQMIRAQNNLYSMASRLSQKSHLFNHFFWEPLNSEGFRKISYNSVDQRNSELLVPLYRDLPQDVPFIATHVWPSQGAVHAGLTHVVNAIPDNWPMGLHLSEGAIHTVQTPFAYLGYKMLNGMDKKPLKGMKEDELFEVGHYVDDELVFNLEEDCKKRIMRIKAGEPKRILITVGGAGAGGKLFIQQMEYLLPLAKQNKVCLLVNFGDHFDMAAYSLKKIKGLKEEAKQLFDSYGEVRRLGESMASASMKGVYLIASKDIFEAVYSTNLLMRVSDILVTKPSELAYYPIPKIMMRHIGGHEVYGAIHGQEEGDSTFECQDEREMNEMLSRLITDDELLIHMVKRIMELKKDGVYDGAYKAVMLAAKGKEGLSDKDFKRFK